MDLGRGVKMPREKILSVLKSFERRTQSEIRQIAITFANFSFVRFEIALSVING